jgi:NAD(P)-dependent dehydrogenase (short-subunit alcohol dehydrogenase family)
MAPFPAPTEAWHTDTYPSIDPSRPELSLAGKSIVITAGGSGIGAAIAQSCAKAGAASIALIGRIVHVLEDNKAHIRSISNNTVEVLVVQADISNALEVDKAFRTIKQTFGGDAPLDILISNAGNFCGLTSLLKDDVDEWFRSFKINVKESLLVTRAFLSAAANNPKYQPTIVHISTAIAHVRSSFFPGFSAYAASKMASTRLFDYVQSERANVYVVSIHPGQVITEMSDKPGREDPTPVDQG